MNPIQSLDYHPGALRYEYVDGQLMHNIADEYALFALWKDAKPFEDRIRQHLANEFEVVLDAEIVWSKKNFFWNACRLYETPVQNTDPGRKIRGHARKIGDPSFRLFIVKDPQPTYAYQASVSGDIAPINTKVAAAKREFRSWIDAPYRVHSSNNINEFYTQAVQLLGVERLTQIFDRQTMPGQVIEKDLEGADGWTSWSHAMAVLKWSVDYVVLRNFETEDLGQDGDIDLLCTNHQTLCSALAARQLVKRGKLYKGRMIVAGKEVSVDARYCGDGYFDRAWQHALLSRKVFANGIFRPRDDDYFFSLLYHAAVHKPQIKPAYQTRLKGFGGALKEIGESLESFESEPVTRALKGYMAANRYVYEQPVDPKVGKNQSVVRHLPKRGQSQSKLARKLRKILSR